MSPSRNDAVPSAESQWASAAFSGYQWDHFSSMSQGPQKERAELFLQSVHWDALLEYAAMKHDGDECKLLPNIGLGYNHMVRIIEFADGDRWVARLGLPSLSTTSASAIFPPGDKELSEYYTMLLVQKNTSIPVPRLYAIETESSKSSLVGAPFILMECLPGNVGMDLGMSIPPGHKEHFLARLAQIHAQLSTVQLPLIGKIVSRNEDGTYNQGPIPGLGGPFKTATDFFQAWARTASFPMPDHRIRDLSGPHYHEIAPSIEHFPAGIANKAHSISALDHGPFPLCHGDFGHNNTIVDDDYNILSLIDWEFAFAAPWEVFAVFPLSIRTVPQAMDLPSAYDGLGMPKDPELMERYRDREGYLAAVAAEEKRLGLDPHLSRALGDSKTVSLMTGMQLYEQGKLGWYSRLLPY